MLGCDCSSLGHLLSPGDGTEGFLSVAGPQFIRWMRGNCASEAAGEQFGCSREMEGEVFILADLFLCCSRNFLSHSDAHAVQSVRLDGHCDSLCLGESRLSPGAGKPARSLTIFRATFGLPSLPLRVRWGPEK